MRCQGKSQHQNDGTDSQSTGCPPPPARRACPPSATDPPLRVGRLAFPTLHAHAKTHTATSIIYRLVGFGVNRDEVRVT